MLHKLVYLAIALAADGIMAGDPARVAEDAAKPTVPAVSKNHREFLMRVARRTIRDAVLGRDVYEPRYVPEALQASNTEAVVRLRQRGFLLAAAWGGPLPIAQAVRDSAVGAVRMWTDNRGDPAELLGKVLLEIEILGPGTPIPVETDWTEPRAVDPFIEPGVHGIALVGPKLSHRFCPTELITAEMVLADALKAIAQKTHRSPDELTKTRLTRFRTRHWYQAAPGDRIVSLERGMSLIPQRAVAEQTLDQTISRLADYMVYRQLPSGLFTYQYEPGRNTYSEEDNLVRQVGATVAMAVHARYSGKSSSLAAADIGIRYHLQGLTDVPGVNDAAFIATADGRNKLGITALLCLAMAEHPHADQYTPIRKKLINGMLWLQQDSGMFLTAFQPSAELRAQEYFPGEALLAMAGHYRHDPSAGILSAFDRAIEFYREYFRSHPSPAFVPWQVQAYAIIAKHSKRTDYNDYVFELADWLAEKQLNRSNCEWPEMWGGIASYQPGRAGVATASYLEGFADALDLARFVGDAARSERYERAVRDAARFVMQLQVRPEEAYFVVSPQDAVGGIRTAPALNLLRIDHCQHALIALIKTRQVLFER